MSAIEKNKVVLFTYQLSEAGGSKIESSDGAAPMTYLHGYNNILPSLEEELAGLSISEQKTITLTPEKAYGVRRDQLTQKFPIKHLASKHKRLLPGTIVKLNTEKGVVDASVIKAGKFMVDLDLNHPFAGKTLEFAIEIIDIRDATEEEIAQGHTHGPGGHDHSGAS